MFRRAAAKLATATLLLPVPAAAHGFGRLYNLPVPFWLYAWAATAALLLSFMVVAIFSTARPTADVDSARDVSAAGWVRALRRLSPGLKLFSVFLLLLCIATALFGNRDPFRNFSMTFFWVCFGLLFTYLTAVLGNFYAALNPWRTLADGVGRLRRGFGAGRLAYPEALGEWPALALFLGFIWFELFNHGRPSTLGAVLLAYTALNLAGSWLIGAAAWFRHCEIFSVFFRLAAQLAPLDYRRAEPPGTVSTLRLRSAFSGLTHERPKTLATVVFLLAMLSTTAFDGLRATQWWVNLFWADPTGVFTAIVGQRPIHAYASLRPWYIGWETFWLLASPFLYLGTYLAFLWLAKVMAHSRRSVGELALDFAYTLLPIALAYNLTHYATLILTQGLKIVSLSSDPFGWGWNLLGSAGMFRAPILPAIGWVWHTQVGIILAGHVLSVYAAHRVALRVFSTRRSALLSQLPMLGLMVLLTVAGLWILAQPLTAELLR